ncbi:DUF2845 domain-containing protein [Paucibacter sp. Y2R2-4]|uniref:DUF2845 domain-containing protein n=1 Tax=Paucibacter sp. Y2R2-4 TaxID=2893553 RepID=UPI0021E3D2FC|nr:DUF2845 domain-containing protein [Paucibacter sp. Y2R2-4]MCV2351252.1 DUF2845 domain-containing protein [Paucibacter sp. Y2R2-4]
MSRTPRNSWAGAMLALAVLLCAPAAQAFRCNSFVIDEGMHKAEVLKKCGAPSLRDSRTEKRIIRVREGALNSTRPGTVNGQVLEQEREILVSIEEWTYNFGPSQFMQLLIFEDGRLKAVQDLGYGS